MGGARIGFLVVVASAVVGCATRPAALPASLGRLPFADRPADRTVWLARGHLERGEPQQALQLVTQVLESEPAHIDALRLRQDLLRERGRKGLVLGEAQQALAQRPDDPVLLYLFGRVVADAALKRRSFERAASLAPQVPWPWLGLAHTLRAEDPSRSIAIYERLFAASSGHPAVAIAYAAALRQAGRHKDAASVYEQLAQNAEAHGAGELGLAQCWLALDKRPAAWSSLLQAVRRRPFDPSVQSLVHSWLLLGASDDQAAQVLDVLREDAGRLRQFGRGEGAAVLAMLLLRQQQVGAACSALEQAGIGPRQPALRRLQRRLLLALGDCAGFLALLRSDLPMARIDSEQNQLRGRWLALLQGTWQQGDPLASAAQSLGLLAALRDVGMLVEVEQIAEHALRRWPGSQPIAALRDEVRAEIAFESGLRRLLYDGYRDRAARGLFEVLDQIRDLSRRTLRRDVVGAPATFRVPFVGEMLDPFAPGLAEHLARYNRHLVLGARSGGVVEGMLLTRLSLAELPPDPVLVLPGRCYEVVAFDRDVRAVSGVVGGDLAGVALLNHHLIDYDAVREWAGTIADRRRIAQEDGLSLQRDPLPEAGRDPLDVAWRLSLLSPVQDIDLDEAVFDTIRQHERQHLVDSFHYLPVEQNLGRALWLLLQFGVSPAAIEAEMERRAELASLAVSPHTELVLAHIADFLGEPDAASPHHRGFADLAAQLDAELQALGVPAAAARPSRWHQLDFALVRQAARRLLDRLR